MFEEWYETYKRGMPETFKLIAFDGFKAGAEEELERCAKKLEDLAAKTRDTKFPHLHEEKAQILEWAASVLRSSDG